MIFKKSLEREFSIADDGTALTHMSTDIEGIADGIKEMHEIWASVLELGVAVYLLQRYIGAACFVAVIPAIGMCNGLSIFVCRSELTIISLQRCDALSYGGHRPR